MISKDPITTWKVTGGTHVGMTVYVNEPTFWDLLPPPDWEAHEPRKVRKYMVDSLADPGTRATVWHSREVTELNPDRNDDERGSTKEMMKLAAAVKRYCSDNGIWFDEAAFDRYVELRFLIDRGE